MKSLAVKTHYVVSDKSVSSLWIAPEPLPKDTLPAKLTNSRILKSEIVAIQEVEMVRLPYQIAGRYW